MREMCPVMFGKGLDYSLENNTLSLLDQFQDTLLVFRLRVIIIIHMPLLSVCCDLATRNVKVSHVITHQEQWVCVTLMSRYSAHEVLAIFLDVYPFFWNRSLEEEGKGSGQ